MGWRLRRIRCRAGVRDVHRFATLESGADFETHSGANVEKRDASRTRAGNVSRPGRDQCWARRESFAAVGESGSVTAALGSRFLALGRWNVLRKNQEPRADFNIRYKTESASDRGPSPASRRLIQILRREKFRSRPSPYLPQYPVRCSRDSSQLRFPQEWAESLVPVRCGRNEKHPPKL